MRRILILMILCCMHLFAEESLTESFEFQAVKLGNQDTGIESWDYSLTIENIYGTQSAINGGEQILFNLADISDDWWTHFFTVTYVTNSFYYPMNFTVTFSDFETEQKAPESTAPHGTWTNEIPLDGMYNATLTYIPHGESWNSGTDSSDFENALNNSVYFSTQNDAGWDDKTKEDQDLSLQLSQKNQSLAFELISATIQEGSGWKTYNPYAVYTMEFSFRFGADLASGKNDYQDLHGFQTQGVAYSYIPGDYKMTVRVVAECGA